MIKMYQEIVKLYQWCKENFISCTLEPLWDGYQIRFLDGSDVVQHSGSYGAKNGCVEPCGMPKAFTAVDISTIKKILSKRFFLSSIIIFSYKTFLFASDINFPGIAFFNFHTKLTGLFPS